MADAEDRLTSDGGWVGFRVLGFPLFKKCEIKSKILVEETPQAACRLQTISICEAVVLGAVVQKSNF